MLNRTLFVSLGLALAASCSSPDSNEGVDPCEPICGSLADAGASDGDGDVGDDAGADDDAGIADPDAGMGDPDAGGQVVCNPDMPDTPGDNADNDCDGLIDELEVCGNTAYPTIASAIAAAPDGSDIEVCAGTYPERLTVTAKSLQIRGAGIGLTILDAEELGRGLTISSTPTGGNVLLEGFTVRNGKMQGNGGAIACANGSLALESVEVTNSSATSSGGGLFTSGCQLTLVDASFVGNSAALFGGGAYTTNSSGSITTSEFRSNTARDGGGLTVINGVMPIDQSQFSLNTAGLQGGGLHYRSNSTISNSQFVDNTAGWTGGGLYVDQLSPTFTNIEVRGNVSENDGGGIYLHQVTGEILNSHFIDNVSNDDGGGIRIFEGGMLVQDNLVENNYAADSGAGIRVSHMPSMFLNNHVRANEAFGVGGGFDMDNCSSQVIGGIIEDNIAGGSGGGIHAWLFPWFDGAIRDVKIRNNHAWQGGGIYLQHNFQKVAMSGLEVTGNTASKGAGIVVRTSDFTLEHSVFTGNVATAEGGALAIGLDGSPYEETICPPCPPTTTTGEIRFVVAHGNQSADGGSGMWIKAPGVSVHSSILSSNAGTAVFVEGASPTWRYNNVTPASFSGMADPSGQNGNMSVAPGFVAPATGDFTLAPTSQCIDKGEPTYVDLDGTTADMGRFGGLGGTL